MTTERLADAGYEGVAEDIFFSKLSLIHDMVVEKGAQMERQGGGEKPDFVIAGPENG